MEFLHKHMIVDYLGIRSSIFFEESSLLIKPNSNITKVSLEINYDDIKDVEVIRGLKSIVLITLNNNDKVQLDLYKANTLAMYIETARNSHLKKDVPEYDFTKKEEEKQELHEDKVLTEEELLRLERITKLYKDGTISKKQFEIEKNFVLNRKK